MRKLVIPSKTAVSSCETLSDFRTHACVICERKCQYLKHSVRGIVKNLRRNRFHYE